MGMKGWVHGHEGGGSMGMKGGVHGHEGGSMGMKESQYFTLEFFLWPLGTPSPGVTFTLAVPRPPALLVLLSWCQLAEDLAAAPIWVLDGGLSHFPGVTCDSPPWRCPAVLLSWCQLARTWARRPSGCSTAG